MPATWSLTGRAEELSLISGLTRRRDGPAGVVLAGAAGVGKTRLAREALAAAERRGALTRWAVATTSARALPLGAFAATLGVVGPDPARLVRQASDALLAGAGRAGVIIGVDDAHLLDELSAMLVHQLALRRVVTVVLTLRSRETAPDEVTALWKDGHLTRLELQPLSEAETATLVEAALGGPLDSAAARRLWTTTRGNVLYLRQLVDGELESSRLRQVAGVWRWSGELALSPGLAELVSARIGQLPDWMSDVIEVLAFGEPLSVPLLAGLTGAAAVEAAEARGLVEVYPDGRRLQVRLAHPLFGEVQREQMGRLRARRLRGRIAEALAATGARRTGDTLRRAVLALDSDLEPDSVLFTGAARRATELGDLALAQRVAGAAVAAGGGFEPRLLLGNAGPPRRAWRQGAADRCPRRLVGDRAAPSGRRRILVGPGAAPGRPAGPGRARRATVPGALPGHPRTRRCDHQLHVREGGEVPGTGPDRGAVVPSIPCRSAGRGYRRLGVPTTCEPHRRARDGR